MERRGRILAAGLGALLIGALLPFAPGAAAAPPTGSPIRALSAPASNAPWARSAVARLPRATAVNDTNANKIFDDLDEAFAASGERRVPVIVSFREPFSTRTGLRAARRVAPDIKVDMTYRLIPAFAGRISLTQALALSELPEVRQLELDAGATLEGETANSVMGADGAIDDLGVSGSLDGKMGSISAKDVGIAVIDSGIAGNHPDFGNGKVRAYLDLVAGGKSPVDNHGHGSNVASIAAGWGREQPLYRGVAPGAALIGVRVLDDFADERSTSRLIRAYEWIVQNRVRHNIRVATMSIGVGGTTDGTSALERAVDATWDAGIVCFKSGGNTGPGYSTISGPGSARGIITMGSVLDPYTVDTAPSQALGFRLSPFSARGPTLDGRVKPDLLAPGERRFGAARSGTGYASFSGTSQTSPFGAGVAALLISANPRLTPDDVRAILFRTAEDWGPKGPDNDFGYGRIQVLEAVLAAARRAHPERVQRPLVPMHTVLELETGPAGVATGAFEVKDLEFPVALAVLTDGEIADVQIMGPTGPVVSREALFGRPLGYNTWQQLWLRQASFSFMPAQTGTYQVVVSAPGSTYASVDVSHSSTRRSRVVRPT